MTYQFNWFTIIRVLLGFIPGYAVGRKLAKRRAWKRAIDELTFMGTPIFDGTGFSIGFVSGFYSGWTSVKITLEDDDTFSDTMTTQK